MNLFNWRVIKKYANKVFLVLVFVVGLTAVSYVFVYRPFAIRQDKERFTKAEASLDEVYNQIVAKVGKPDEVKKDKSCHYANRAYGKGPRSCSVGIYLLYENKNSSSASSITEKLAAIAGTKLTLFGEKTTASFIPSENKRGDQTLTQENKTIEGLACSTDYIYPVLPSSSKRFQPVSSENLEVVIACGGPAKAEHFTVKN